MPREISNSDLGAVALSSKIAFWDRVMLVSGGRPSAWAAQLDINPTTVTHWRDSPRSPYKTTLARLVEKTGIPLEWWLRGEGEIPLDAARRFGLLPSGAVQTGPNNAEGRMTHGQYARAMGPLPANPLPALHRTAASQRHAAFQPMFMLFLHLWSAEQLSWLPDGASLEQVAFLVNEAVPLFEKSVGEPPEFGNLSVTHVVGAANAFSGVYLTHLRPVVHLDTTPI